MSYIYYLCNETYEINANSRNIRLRIGIVSKPEKQTGFTNTRVSDKKQFKEVIAAKKREEKNSFDEHGEKRNSWKLLCNSGRIQKYSAQHWHCEHN